MTNETPLNVYQAISKVQAGLAKEGISKDRKNEQQGYKFRGIDDIYNALAGLLAENGLCILPRVLSRELRERVSVKEYNGQRKETALFYVVVDVEYDFVSAHDGSKHTVRVLGEAMDSGDKATNKAMSAAYKYACLQTFSIPTEGDNDADATTHEVKAKAPSPFKNAALRKSFCDNVVASFREATTLAELDELAGLNKPKFAEMDASDNEHDHLGVEEMRKQYAAARARIKAAEKQADEVSASYGQEFAETR